MQLSAEVVSLRSELRRTQAELLQVKLEFDAFREAMQETQGQLIARLSHVESLQGKREDPSNSSQVVDDDNYSVEGVWCVCV